VISRNFHPIGIPPSACKRPSLRRGDEPARGNINAANGPILSSGTSQLLDIQRSLCDPIVRAKILRFAKGLSMRGGTARTSSTKARDGESLLISSSVNRLKAAPLVNCSAPT
jgi:hypothetical protein